MMMMKLRCWMPDYENEVDASEFDINALPTEEAAAAEFAAGDAMEKWEAKGRWAGESVPDEMTVHVRAPSGAVFAVCITHDYSINFYTGDAKLVT